MIIVFVIVIYRIEVSFFFICKLMKYDIWNMIFLFLCEFIGLDWVVLDL